MSVGQEPGTLSEAPGQDHETVSPADTPLSRPYRAVYVGTGGDVKLTAIGGGVAVYKNVASGFIIPIAVSQVWTTGTTASNMVGMR